MFWEEDFPEWFRSRRRRRYPFFFEDIFEEMNRMMEEMFKDLTGTMPKELIRERKLPEGGTVKEFGPFVYGYSMTIGPDGKPIIREFGNIKPSFKRGLEVKEEREPLVDTMVDEKTVKVIAELPGVDKSDIKLNATEKSLTISVDTEKRKYYKELELPVEVDPESAKASYKNGVLEVTLDRIKPQRAGKEVKIE
ncbi:MAG: archaeal heat shock protein Hsp20 [Candidatus Bathyarchaeia archaeon]